jgi:hypothetical protein
MSAKLWILLVGACAIGAAGSRAFTPLPTIVLNSETAVCPKCPAVPVYSCQAADDALTRMTERLNTCVAKLPKAHSAAGYVTIASPIIRGTLSGDGVKRVANQHVDEIRQCYADALERDATIHGRMAAKFIVIQDGWVQVAAVDFAHFDDVILQQCVVHKIRTWTFQRLGQGSIAVVSLPIEFQPEPPTRNAGPR